MCRYLQRQPLLLMLVLPIVLAPTSMVRAPALLSQRMRSSASSFTQSAQFKEQIAQIPTLTNWMSRMDSHITKTLEDFATRLTEMEQNFSTLTARMCKVETYAASASSVSGSARSWPSGESSDDKRNTRRRLDTLSSTEDQQSRSAVFLQFPCEQYHKGITKWIDNLWEESNLPACNKPVRIQCKAGSVSVRHVFETRAK